MEKIDVAIIVDGKEKARIKMSEPQESRVYKEELTWYTQTAIAPYSVTVHITRRGDLASPVASKDLPPPKKDAQASLM